LRSGLLGYSCDTCNEGLTEEQKQDPDASYIKVSRGCEKPTQMPSTIRLDPDEEWYNCPLRFISQSVHDFLGKYDAYKKGLSTPPDYDDQAQKFIEAVNVFEYYIGKYVNAKKGI